MSSAAEAMAHMYPTNNVYGLRLYAHGPVMNFEVRYFADRTSDNYIARFLKLKGKIIMEKLKLDDEEQKLFCDEDVDLTEDLLQFVVRHFEQILDMHKRTLQHLSLLGPAFYEKLKDYDFHIELIRNLNSVWLETGLDIPSQLAKIENRLNYLYISQVDTSENLAHIEKIYAIPRLDIEYLKLTGRQLYKLKATRAIINIGRLQEMDVYKFIHSWKKGNSKRNVESYEWCHLEKSRCFNKTKFFKRFGKTACNFKRQETVEVKIRQDNSSKTARVIFKNNRLGGVGNDTQSLEFIVNSNGRQQ